MPVNFNNFPYSSISSNSNFVGPAWKRKKGKVSSTLLHDNRENTTHNNKHTIHHKENMSNDIPILVNVPPNGWGEPDM